MSWGTDVDTMVLTPEDFEAQHAVAPTHYESEANVCPKCSSASDARSCRKCGVDRVPSKVRKEWTWVSDTCRAWKAEQEAAGKTVLSAEDYEQRKRAVEVLQQTKQVRELLLNSRKQVRLTGLYCVGGREYPVRALLDIVPNSSHPTFGWLLFDLKTSHTADPRRWSRVVIEHSLHVQAAFYLDFWNAATGEDRQDFGHVVQERFAPYEVMEPFAFLAGDFIAAGRATYRKAMEVYDRCIMNAAPNEWPGYSQVESDIGLPPQMADVLQRIAPPRWWTLSELETHLAPL
jgi:ribosomal protein L40E